MTIKIRFASELGIKPEEIQLFYKINWTRPIALADSRFYNWQFISPPEHNQNNLCVIALETETCTVFGSMGLTMRSFYLNENIKRRAELTTWVVDPKKEGSCLDAKILLYIKDKSEVLIGMGISEKALSVHMRSNFRYLNYIPRFVKILNFENTSKISKFSPSAPKLVKK